MRCPIQSAAEVIGSDIGTDGYSNANAKCDKSDCAWWDSETGKCAILLLAKALNKQK